MFIAASIEYKSNLRCMDIINGLNDGRKACGIAFFVLIIRIRLGCLYQLCILRIII